MNAMLHGAPQSDEDERSNEDSQHLGKKIDGALFPKKERQIDRLGFELTKHALHFHGKAWEYVLQNKRDDLTHCITHDAAAATHEPEENIQDVRFITTRDYLDVKCMIRHKTHTTANQIQDMLAKFHWSGVKGLYDPSKENAGRTNTTINPNTRQRTHHRSNHASTSMQQAKRLAKELSEYGRANVGPDGVAFKPGKDMDEEPEPADAPFSRQASNMFAVGFPS